MELTVHLNRDSVHPGDDMVSHASTMLVDSDMSIGALLVQIKRNYLPGIAGGEAAWIISCSGNAPSPLGVLAQEWQEPKIRIPLETPFIEVLGSSRQSISFEYWCQKDPGFVFNRIAAGKEPPPR